MQQNLFAPAKSQLEEKFQEFHAKNPHVYDNLVRLAEDLKARGHRKIGIQMLFEVIRWQSMLKTTDKDFKLNNNYAAYYARLIMDRNVHLDGFFEIRELRS